MHILHENVKIPLEKLPNSFAEFCNNKIKTALDSTQINQNVYNGKRKVISNNKMFMGQNEILECVNSIKIKNCDDMIEFLKGY